MKDLKRFFLIFIIIALSLSFSFDIAYCKPGKGKKTKEEKLAKKEAKKQEKLARKLARALSRNEVPEESSSAESGNTDTRNTINDESEEQETITVLKEILAKLSGTSSPDTNPDTLLHGKPSLTINKAPEAKPKTPQPVEPPEKYPSF